jgi:hypothetical protein
MALVFKSPGIIPPIQLLLTRSAHPHLAYAQPNRFLELYQPRTILATSASSNSSCPTTPHPMCSFTIPTAQSLIKRLHSPDPRTPVISDWLSISGQSNTFRDQLRNIGFLFGRAIMGRLYVGFLTGNISLCTDQRTKHGCQMLQGRVGPWTSNESRLGSHRDD